MLIDYQPEQYRTITSSTRDEIDLNVIALCKLARAYDITVIVSTVGVDMGVNTGTAQGIMDELPGVTEIDRTGVNAWEDEEFRNAIEATGRKKIVMAGLWTEVCLTFPTLDMQAAGYQVYPVADAVGGISAVAHDRAIERMQAAGATPITAIQFGSELMRNWARDSSDKFRKVLQWYFPKRFALMKKAGSELIQPPAAGSRRPAPFPARAGVSKLTQNPARAAFDCLIAVAAPCRCGNVAGWQGGHDMPHIGPDSPSAAPRGPCRDPSCRDPSCRDPRAAFLALLLALPGLAGAEQLRILTSMPPAFTDPFIAAFRRLHPDADILVLNKNTNSGVDEIARGNPRGFDLFWASAPEAFALIGQHGGF